MDIYIRKICKWIWKKNDISKNKSTSINVHKNKKIKNIYLELNRTKKIDVYMYFYNIHKEKNNKIFVLFFGEEFISKDICE